MKKIIAGIVAVLLLVAGWFIWQNMQDNNFRESSVRIYNSYKILIDDGNKTTDNMRGRSYENIFAELNSIKQKNQELKIAASSLKPRTADLTKIHKLLIDSLNLHDEGLTDIISLLEKERMMKFESFNNQSANYKKAETEYNAAISKYLETGKKSRDARRLLQAALGVAVDPQDK